MPIVYASGSHGLALRDFADALDAAEATRDPQGRETLLDLLYAYLEETLHAKTPARLMAYLRSRTVWRRAGAHAVFKSAGQPCVCFMALEMNGMLCVLVLGACHAYPVSEDHWWSEVIRPRLEDYV